MDPELGSQACALAKGPGLLNFHSLQNAVVSWGEGVTVRRKGNCQQHRSCHFYNSIFRNTGSWDMSP